MWLLHAEGLPLGSWLAKMDLDGTCKLCDQGSLETAQHAFFECTAVKTAWEQFNQLRQTHSLPQLTYSAADILDGQALANPNLTVRKFSNPCRVTSDTPWDILRCLLLRTIWCQRCSKVMRDEPFHLGAAINGAWRTVIQIGVAAWRGLWKKSHEPDQRIETFKDTWAATDAFCTFQGFPVWKFIPDPEFLPQDLASRPQVQASIPTIPTIQLTSTGEKNFEWPSQELTTSNTHKKPTAIEGEEEGLEFGCQRMQLNPQEENRRKEAER